MIKVNQLHLESKQKITRIEEYEKLKDSEAKQLEKEEFISDNSKVFILTNFVRCYESSLLKIFNAKYGVFMHIDEFSLILYDIKFIIYDPKNISEEGSSKKKDENKLVAEAWKFLTSGDNKIETVDSNIRTKPLLTAQYEILNPRK